MHARPAILHRHRLLTEQSPVHAHPLLEPPSGFVSSDALVLVTVSPERKPAAVMSMDIDALTVHLRPLSNLTVIRHM